MPKLIKKNLYIKEKLQNINDINFLQRWTYRILYYKSNTLAFVTGGGRGLGEAIARVMAREGAQVTVGDLDPEACNQVIEKLENSAQHLAVKLDVSKKSSIEESMKKFSNINYLMFSGKNHYKY